MIKDWANTATPNSFGQPHAVRFILIFRNFLVYKVEKILKSSMDSMSTPTPSVKIQITKGQLIL